MAVLFPVMRVKTRSVFHVKQKTAKPGDPIADASTEIGSEDIEIPDISEALKAAQDAKNVRREWVICRECGERHCPYGYWITIG
jgi:hypothetical protein